MDLSSDTWEAHSRGVLARKWKAESLESGFSSAMSQDISQTSISIYVEELAIIGDSWDYDASSLM